MMHDTQRLMKRYHTLLLFTAFFLSILFFVLIPSNEVNPITPALGYAADCPGVADGADAFHHVPLEYATIQAAINAAGAGETVCVDDNGATYNESLTITTANLTLLGSPNGNSIGPGAGAPTIERSSGGAPVIAVGANGVTINGFIVSATTGGPGIWTDGSALQNVTVRNTEVTGIDGPAVGFPHGTGPVTDNAIIFNEIHGNDAQGVYLATPGGTCAGGVGSNLNLQRNVVANNDIYANDCDTGCNAYSFNIQINCASGDNIVINNTVRDIADSADSFENGAYFYNTSDNVVTCNTFDNNFERGMILWHPDGAPPAPNIIQYNSFTNNGPSSALWSVGGDALATATLNWWGAAPPPAGPPNNPDNVTANPYLNSAGEVADGCAAPEAAKVFAPDNILVGQTSTLTLTISNNYLAAPLYNVLVSDQLPGGGDITFTGAVPTNTCGGAVDTTGNSNTLVTISGFDLPTGVSSCTVELVVQGNAPGTYDNTGLTLEAPASGEVNGTPDTLVVGALAVDLAVTKNDGGVTYTPGGTISYTINYSNQGNVALTGVTLSETVPANTTFNAAASTAGWSCADGSPAGTTCDLAIGALAVGANGSAVFAVDVDPAIDVDAVPEISNTVTITDDGENGEDENPANNTATDTTPRPADNGDPIEVIDPAISKLGLLGPGELGLPGETITWQITVRNTGGGDAANVVVTDTLNSNLTILNATTPQGTASISGQTVTFNLGTVVSGQSITMEIVTRVTGTPADGIIPNTACVSGGLQGCADASVNVVSGLPDTGYPPAE